MRTLEEILKFDSGLTIGSHPVLFKRGDDVRAAIVRIPNRGFPRVTIKIARHLSTFQIRGNNFKPVGGINVSTRDVSEFDLETRHPEKEIEVPPLRESNPIHRVPGGWQWGKHGHIYPDRAGAVRQAKAAYAHGFRERNPMSDKDPASMTASQINAEIERIDKADSKVVDELIAAGRGEEKYWDILNKDDELSRKAIALRSRRHKLMIEIDRRAGPGFHRMPRGLRGPRREHNPMNNIEKSTRPGQYVGYQQGRWHIYRSPGYTAPWYAVKTDEPMKNAMIRARTLKDLSRDLEHWKPTTHRESNPVRDPEHKQLLGELQQHFEKDEKYLKRLERERNPSWHQRKAMRERGGHKLESGWWIVDDTGGFLSYIGPFKTEKEAKELLEVRSKNGASGVVIYRGDRSGNPLPIVTHVRRLYYVARARKGHEVLYLTRGGKLIKGEANAARHRSIGEAQSAAVAHLRKFPHSRAYKFEVAPAY